MPDELELPELAPELEVELDAGGDEEPVLEDCEDDEPPPPHPASATAPNASTRAIHRRGDIDLRVIDCPFLVVFGKSVGISFADALAAVVVPVWPTLARAGVPGVKRLAFASAVDSRRIDIWAQRRGSGRDDYVWIHLGDGSPDMPAATPASPSSRTA